MSEDDLKIPAFLIVTPEIAAARRKYNEEHPLAPASIFIPPKVERSLSEEGKRIVAEQETIRQTKKHNSLHKMLDNKKNRWAPGMQWRNGRWVDPNQMSLGNYNRILRELPTEKHRKIFVDLYSSRVRTAA